MLKNTVNTDLTFALESIRNLATAALSTTDGKSPSLLRVALSEIERVLPEADRLRKILEDVHGVTNDSLGSADLPEKINS